MIIEHPSKNQFMGTLTEQCRFFDHNRCPVTPWAYSGITKKSDFILGSATIGDGPWREFEVGFMTVKKTDHFVYHQGKHPGITRGGHPSNMGAEEYVGELNDFAVGWNRLRIEDVKPGDNIPAFETGYQRVGIDNSPA